MKKTLYLLTTILTTSAALFLSSCLKDNSHYVNFDTGQTLVDFPLGGFLNFGSEAVIAPADTTPGDIGNTKTEIGLNVASANVPTIATTIQLKIADPADVTAINALQSSVVYTLLPAADYVAIPTTMTIPSGQQYTTFTVTVHKSLLNPSLSYVLPIKILSGTNAKLTSNLNVYYLHFIGNDFAGTYTHHYYTRHSVPDTTGSYATSDAGHPVDEGPATFLPVTPSTFQVQSFYYTGIPYTVSFTKAGLGATATYSNWTVTFAAADITTYFTDPDQGVQLASGPSFDPNPSYFNPAFDPAASYSYAQSLKIFRFYYTTLTRAVVDEYVK